MPNPNSPALAGNCRSSNSSNTAIPVATLEAAATLRAAGFDFYDWGEGAARLVTSWQHQDSDVAPLADAIRAL